MLTVEHLATPPPDFLADEVEGYLYYKAFNDAGIEDFQLGYLVVIRNGRRVAVVPYFVMRYCVNTTLPDGPLKRMLGWLRFKIACAGHPSADFGRIDGEISAEVLRVVNAELFKLAAVVSYKDFAAGLPLDGFSMQPNLPVARLDVAGDFYAGLRGSVRREFRQRLRRAQSLRIEECGAYPREHAARIHELYLQTHARAEMQLEKLTPQFFANVAAISKYVLYWENDVLIGFSLLICKDRFMLGKYLGMDYARAPKYGLYFVMMLNHVDICVRDGYTVYQTGASSYDFKQRLGSRLIPAYIYFRHRNPLIHRMLALLMKLVAYG
ncbi:MAG: GNAT family N-acetyltransferase [Burkholderiales bacterium]